METTVLYYKAKQNSISASSSVMDDNSPSDENVSLDVVDDVLNAVNGNIVWAGLEPVEFTALFPDWIERKDVGQINIQVCRVNRTMFLHIGSVNKKFIYLIFPISRIGWSK